MLFNNSVHIPSSCLFQWQDCYDVSIFSFNIFSDLFKDDAVLSLQQLPEIFNIPNNISGSLQLRHFIPAAVSPSTLNRDTEIYLGALKYKPLCFHPPWTVCVCQAAALSVHSNM